jgi:hypothetical protein
VYSRIVILRIAILCLCLGAPGRAQPASDLLQSGIFAQDTAGDLDRAIRIYRQILSGSPEMRLYGAQAQYRLGICLLRKGETASAVEALQAVIRNYPEARELVARARESMPTEGGLLPAPWSETEVAEYRWTIPNVDDGWSLTRIAPAGDKKNLRILMNFYSPRLYTTMVDVERAGMRPIHATYRATSQPILHGGSQRTGGTGRAFEYGEALYVLRRMPLSAGWAATLPVIAPDGSHADLNASVVSLETVTVPAGTFKCFKVLLATDPKISPPKYSAVGTDWQVNGAGQWLWYATDGARALVKMQVGEFSGELTGLRTGEQLGTTSFRDPQVGFSFTVPSGWTFHSRPSFSGPATSVDLLDPDFQVMVTISFKSKKTAPENIQQELVTGAVDKENLRPNLVTPGTLEIGQIGGHPSIEWIGERTGPEGKIVRWTTWMQSENSRGSIAVAVPAAEFDKFRARFQSILNSFRMP